jgi:hypothetical protein
MSTQRIVVVYVFHYNIVSNWCLMVHSKWIALVFMRLWPRIVRGMSPIIILIVHFHVNSLNLQEVRVNLFIIILRQLLSLLASFEESQLIWIILFVRPCMLIFFSVINIFRFLGMFTIRFHALSCTLSLSDVATIFTFCLFKSITELLSLNLFFIMSNLRIIFIKTT